VFTPDLDFDLPSENASDVLLPPPPPTPPPHPPTPPPLPPPPLTTIVSSESSDWPQHMVDANRYFTEETIVGDGESVVRDWGDEWLNCVGEYVKFQRRGGFPDNGAAFPSAPGIRPPEISVWMKNRRPWKDVELVDKDRFKKQWWAWWISLQPKTRVRDDGNNAPSPTVDMDWSSLEKHGRNGFLLIMLALVWLGKASNRDDGWLKAVREVTLALRCMQGAGSNTRVVNKQESTNTKAAKRGRGDLGVVEGSQRLKRTKR
jgi:hypothetical protein